VQAALITGRHRLELIEVPEPEPAPAGVVVDITYCGICGTDIHAFQSGAPYNPAICGHEWVGTVSAAGAEVTAVAEGDRVVVAVPTPCGSCAACLVGRPESCTVVLGATLGRDMPGARHGGFASRLAVPAGRVVAAHPGLSDEQAAQVEPATVSFHAVRRAGIRLGDTVAVQGAGPIGLLVAQWARVAGAGQVVVIEPDPARRQLSDALGATVSVAPDAGPEAVAERTGGLGADVVFECVGRPAAVQRAVDLTRRGGVMALVGLADQDAPITPRTWLVKEITAVGSLAYDHRDFGLAMALIADGRVALEPLHSSTVGLAGLSDTLGELAAGSSPLIKVLVDPRR